ncbi:MAG: acyl-CoA dehydrogenase [Candidatus Hydrogenedentes bacterium]|jgi:alkylation response protein AidB-like acyl-CoA dehydrogenase|nr:acyl-CoA dehydrogenase [Candidatus Hydrogenedentota bacterium]
MSTVLTEEQEMLLEAASEFCSEQAPVSEFRRLRDEKDKDGFSRDLWRDMAELGWAGILVPEEYGGADFGYRGLGVILEESGKCLVASPLLNTALIGVSTLRLAGNEAQQKDVLPAIATGERLLALAVDEGLKHSPSSISCRAEKTASGYKLSGEKVFVLDGHVADQLIVVARTSGNDTDEKGITLFLVDSDTQGITRTRTHMVDNRNAARVVFADVEVPETAVLGKVDEASGVLSKILDRACIGLAAEMLGGAMEVFKRTIEYMREREQFGVAIGTFQALQHRASELYAELELMRASVHEALGALDDDSDEVPLLASLAKAQANDTYYHVSAEGIQIHGGIGMTDEHDMGFFFKRAALALQTFGDSHFHRDRYATIKGY